MEYAQSEGYILLAEKGYLSRYAMRKGVAVMSLGELEELCEQRRRRDPWRKDRLKSYYKDKADTTEEEPKQQAIDDDITF